MGLDEARKGWRLRDAFESETGFDGRGDRFAIHKGREVHEEPGTYASDMATHIARSGRDVGSGTSSP